MKVLYALYWCALKIISVIIITIMCMYFSIEWICKKVFTKNSINCKVALFIFFAGMVFICKKSLTIFCILLTFIVALHFVFACIVVLTQKKSFYGSAIKAKTDTEIDLNSSSLDDILQN